MLEDSKADRGFRHKDKCSKPLTLDEYMKFLNSIQKVFPFKAPLRKAVNSKGFKL